MMASSSIPPLLCNTPPPMDDDFGAGADFAPSDVIDDDDDEQPDIGGTRTMSGVAFIEDCMDDVRPAAQLAPVPDEHRTRFDAFDDIPPLDRLRIATPPPIDASPTPPPPSSESPVRRQCDSPPSLDFNDPVCDRLPGDGECDQVYVDDDQRTDRFSLSDDLPCDPDAHRPSAIASRPATPASVGGAENSALASTDDGEPTPAINQTGESVSPVDFNDSFDEFVEYETTADDGFGGFADVPTATLHIDHNSNTVTTDDNRRPEIEMTNVAATETETSTSVAFSADFSQFAGFEANFDEPSAFAAGDATESPAEPSQRDSDVAIGSSSLALDDDDDDFGDFAEVSVPTPTKAVPAVPAQCHDDDDFGDFGDFSEPVPFTAGFPAVQPLSVVSVDLQDIRTRIGPLLEMMFAPDSDDDGPFETQSKTLAPIDAKCSDITDTILRHADEPLALRLQWPQSTSKADLVQALGIDAAKIWNQSMPRFASNLGFAPLEPTKSTGDIPCLRPTPVALSVKTAQPIESVPAAQFDWSGAGLVNPLDGVQAILHEAGHPQDRPPRPDADWPLDAASAAAASAATGAFAAPSAAAANAADHDAFVASDDRERPPSPQQRRNELLLGTALAAVDRRSSSPTSTTRVLPGPAGGLKETHIFTPSKSRTHSLSDAPGDVIIIDDKVVKKEYRDIEYNPTPLPGDLCTMTGSSIVRPTASWPASKHHNADDFDAFASAATVRTEAPVMESFNEFLSATEDPVPAASNATDDPSDAFDDFSDFQYVPLPVPESQPKSLPPSIGHNGVAPPMGIMQPLQPIPAVKATHQPPTISWSGNGDTSIDPDELARLEAIFPTPKSIPPPRSAPAASVHAPPAAQPKSPAKSADVEWSDFVSSDVGYQPIAHIITQNVLMHQQQEQQQQQSAADDDDWSDFISGSVLPPTISPQKQSPFPVNFPTTFLPNIPAMASNGVQHQNGFAVHPKLTPKHQQLPNIVGNGIASKHVAPSVIETQFAKPSISLIPDLGAVFGAFTSSGVQPNNGK